MSFPLMLLVTALSASADEYTFPVTDAVITLQVQFPDPYNGQRLAFYSGSKQVCLSAETGFAGCSEHFVGSIALVQYSVQSTGRRKPGKIREAVHLVGQSEGLPARPMFGKTVKLVNGVASDIQLFGYEEDGRTPEAERVQARAGARQLFRRFRQELFLDGERQPFAVLEWVHTVRGIKLARVQRVENSAGL